jgi:hypothetical protein
MRQANDGNEVSCVFLSEFSLGASGPHERAKENPQLIGELKETRIPQRGLMEDRLALLQGREGRLVKAPSLFF